MTPETAKHTPGPIHIEDEGNLVTSDGYSLTGANAKHAMLCWNFHEELLAACEAAPGVETSDDCRADHHGYCQGHGLEPIDECWVKKCEVVIAKIAKAKGEGNGE